MAFVVDLRNSLFNRTVKNRVPFRLESFSNLRGFLLLDTNKENTLKQSNHVKPALKEAAQAFQLHSNNRTCAP